METEATHIRCPHCKSTNWTCYDEQTEDFEITATGEIFEMPVGYMKCAECGRGFIHYDTETGVKHLGRWDDDLEDYR